MSINRMNAPIISKQALIHVIQVIMPRPLGRESNLFDMGYEAAKRDVAIALGKHMLMDISDNPAAEIIRNLRRGDE